MNKKRNKVLLLDDNESFLLTIKEKAGFTFCTLNQLENAVITEVKKKENQISIIAVNANLKFRATDKRTQRAGLKLLQQLAFEIFDKRFLVLSFENLNSIKKSDPFVKRLLEADDVEFVDFTQFPNMLKLN